MIRLCALMVIVGLASGCGAVEILKPGENFNTVVIIPNEWGKTKEEATQEPEKNWLGYLGDAIVAPIIAMSDTVTYGISACTRVFSRAIGVPEGLQQIRFGRGLSIFSMEDMLSFTIKRGDVTATLKLQPGEKDENDPGGPAPPE